MSADKGKGQKKNAFRRYPRQFTIRFRFNAVADKRQCSSAASNPRRNKRFKLCRAFCAAKLPSHQIWRSRNASRWPALPSASWFFLTAASKILTCRRRLGKLPVRQTFLNGHIWQSLFSARYSRYTPYSFLCRRFSVSPFPPGHWNVSVSDS